jgi:nucleoid-associated protein YgaU
MIVGPSARTSAGRLSATLEQDPKTWAEGFRAGEERKSKCPYPAGSREAWSWSSGRIEGEAKREGFSYSNPIQRSAEKAGQKC